MAGPDYSLADGYFIQIVVIKTTGFIECGTPDDCRVILKGTSYGGGLRTNKARICMS